MDPEQQQLLEAEAEALRVLRQATRAAEQTDGDEEVAAAVLLMLLMRGWGRAIKLATLKAELLVAETLDAYRASDAVRVNDRIGKYATRYSARWRRAAIESRGNGATRGAARRAASRVTLSYGEMVATTEASIAYNSSRELSAMRYAQSTNDVVWLEWNAALDRRTCPECEYSDGQRILAIVGWGGDGPGAVHPRCRCVSRIIVERRPAGLFVPAAIIGASAA